MQQINFEDVLSKILEKDSRYDREAYIFLRDALEFTQKAISKANKGKTGHISGQQLLNGIREYALAMFGPMALTVLEEWGVRKCEDFGNMVFSMVENGLLHKTEKDSPDDFKNVFTFEEAFRDPFIPSSKKTGASGTQPRELEKN
ncbi:MAG: Minf_1886 family protein [Verrucomicrobiota bacterium]